MIRASLAATHHALGDGESRNHRFPRGPQFIALEIIGEQQFSRFSQRAGNVIGDSETDAEQEGEQSRLHDSIQLPVKGFTFGKLWQ